MVEAQIDCRRKCLFDLCLDHVLFGIGLYVVDAQTRAPFKAKGYPFIEQPS